MNVWRFLVFGGVEGERSEFGLFFHRFALSLFSLSIRSVPSFTRCGTSVSLLLSEDEGAAAAFGAASFFFLAAGIVFFF